MTASPLLRGYRSDGIFASRAGQAISVETFSRDVAALAELLPSRGAVVNLCADRYRFTVGFAAALCRGQVSLLPPHDAPQLLRRLRTDYPDLYCLTDTPEAAPGVDTFHYPALRHDGTTPAIPLIPADQPAAVLFTSGSTGQPQPHARSWGELVSSALAEGGRLAIVNHAVSLGTVPHQHSYGLESLVMLPMQHGMILHAERLFYAADIRARIAAAPRPRMLVTTPVHLRVLLAEPEPPPPVDLVLCATAPLAAQLARQAEARFAVSLLEIYGCSEAGQIASRRTALTEEWQCLDGISLRRDDAGIWASGTPIAVETLLPDVIELRDATRFLLHGRIADMVNVAGKRTSLVHLNYHLNAIDGVVDGAFALADEGETGAVSRLAAFVVAPGRSAESILAALRDRIDAAFLPRPVCMVPALPRNALGKLPREEIQRLIADARRGTLSEPEGDGSQHRRNQSDHPDPSSYRLGPSSDRHGPSSLRHGPARPGHPTQRRAEGDPPVEPGDDVARPKGDAAAPGRDAAAPGGDAESPVDDAATPGAAASQHRWAGTVTHRFALDHPSANGHFPGNPIIPGAVLLREIVAAIAPGTAREIRSAKFHQPVRPGDQVAISWAAGPEGEIRFSCSIDGAGRPAVTGTLCTASP